VSRFLQVLAHEAPLLCYARAGSKRLITVALSSPVGFGAAASRIRSDLARALWGSKPGSTQRCALCSAPARAWPFPAANAGIWRDRTALLLR